MTVMPGVAATTLEHLEFTIEEPEILCDHPFGCDCSATFIIRTVCGCVRLRCLACTTRFILDCSQHLGAHFRCKMCGWLTPLPILKISDFVESVRPL